MKASEAGLIGERRENDKGTYLYIPSITSSAPRENLPSNVMVKRKFSKMMGVYRNDGSLSSKVPGKPMLGFWDSEKVRGIMLNCSPSNHD